MHALRKMSLSLRMMMTTIKTITRMRMKWMTMMLREVMLVEDLGVRRSAGKPWRGLA